MFLHHYSFASTSCRPVRDLRHASRSPPSRSNLSTGPRTPTEHDSLLPLPHAPPQTSNLSCTIRRAHHATRLHRPTNPTRTPCLNHDSRNNQPPHLNKAHTHSSLAIGPCYECHLTDTLQRPDTQPACGCTTHINSIVEK